MVSISRFIVALPYSPADQWQLMPDGRVAVARTQPFRIEFWREGHRDVIGPTLEYDPIPVTDEDRAFHRRPEAQFKFDELPLTKPPFLTKALIPSLDGRVWLARTYPVEGGGTRYDVFDGRGERLFAVELPENCRIVHVGESLIYEACKDALDLYSLMAYELR